MLSLRNVPGKNSHGCEWVRSWRAAVRVFALIAIVFGGVSLSPAALGAPGKHVASAANSSRTSSSSPDSPASQTLATFARATTPTLLSARSIKAQRPLTGKALDRIVAFVDGEVVTGGDLEFWVWEECLRRGNTSEGEIPGLRAQVLNQIVDEILIDHWAQTRIGEIDEDAIDHAVERTLDHIEQFAPTKKIFKSWLDDAGYNGPALDLYLRARERRLWRIRAALAIRLQVMPEQLDGSQLHKADNAEKPVRLRLRHILFRCAPQNTDEANSQTLLAALALRREILKGALSFPEAALIYSQDASTNETGGYLGWVGVQEVAPAIAEAASKLREGAISDPIKTRLGWSLIQLLDYDTPSSLLLLRRVEQAHNEILAEMKQQKTLRVAPDLALPPSSAAPGRDSPLPIPNTSRKSDLDLTPEQ